MNYESHRKSRNQGGKYHSQPKTETSLRSESLRIAASAIRDLRLRYRIEAVLIVGLENADDTMVDGYRALERAEYPKPADFWAMMFISSVQDALSRATDKRVHRFFNSRGVAA